jgi:hypothetical protein
MVYSTPNPPWVRKVAAAVESNCVARRPGWSEEYQIGFYRDNFFLCFVVARFIKTVLLPLGSEMDGLGAHWVVGFFGGIVLTAYVS